METGHIIRHQAAPRRASGSERFRNIALGLAGIISSVLIPLIGFYYASRDKEREVSKGFVEIATRFSDKPTDDNKPLREWAIALIDNYSAVRLPEDARVRCLTHSKYLKVPVRLGPHREPGCSSFKILDHAGPNYLAV